MNFYTIYANNIYIYIYQLLINLGFLNNVTSYKLVQLGINFRLYCCYRGQQVTICQFNAMSPLKKRKNNMTERNEKKNVFCFLLSNVVVKHAIMPTVMEQEKCYEVRIHCLWDAEETSLQTKCGSSDRC